MEAHERYLYHQIHPAKLATDICSAVAGVYLLWKRRPAAALVGMFVPAVLASWTIICRADLRPQKDSALGRYVAMYMTRPVEVMRSAGMLVMALGGWYHRPWLILVGLTTIVLGWTHGLLVPRRTAS